MLQGNRKIASSPLGNRSGLRAQPCYEAPRDFRFERDVKYGD